MILPLALSRVAEDDLHDAAAWYHARQPGSYPTRSHEWSVRISLIPLLVALSLSVPAFGLGVMVHGRVEHPQWIGCGSHLNGSAGHTPELRDLYASNEFRTAYREYVAYTHWCRYIRSGATKIESTFDATGHSGYGGANKWDTFHSVNISAWANAQDRDLILVIINMRSSSYPLEIKLQHVHLPAAQALDDAR